jgi:hypothetical protein
MDPNDEELVTLVTEDIERIVRKDKRVEIINTTVYISEHSIAADVELKYLPFDSVESLYLIFEKEMDEGIE